MAHAQSEESELASGEEAQAPALNPPAGSTTVTRLEANELKRVFPTRRKLSVEQEGEVARLYADTTTPVSEVARSFGIAESSVYRVAQRHGAALRGRRTALSAPPAEPAAAPTAAPAQTERGPSSAQARLQVTGATLGRFRIRFLAERVVQARDIRDALRQAESFEAVEVTAIMREV